MSDEPRTRLYGLCVHYGLKKDEDWTSNRDEPLRIRTQHVARKLGPDLRYLRKILEKRKTEHGQYWEGFAFIFLDMGWASLVDLSGEPVDLLTFWNALSDAQTQIESAVRRDLPNGEPREEIVTAKRLLDLIRNLQDRHNGPEGGRLKELLLGGSDAMKYDAPKVFEGVVRIANIGRAVPIFRFDDDVLFYGRRSQGANENHEADEAAGSLLRLCDHYQELLSDPRVHYFVYSGGYDEPSRGGVEKQNDLRVVNGFATRVLHLTTIPKMPSAPLQLSSETVWAFLTGLYRLGANPYRQVISGAGLCLSDSAILDLPPFSNMHLNVMWIDDHLKYALHDELGHLGRHSRTHKRARVAGVTFKQLRAKTDAAKPAGFDLRDVLWHLETYMPRLVLGCVADSWLRETEKLKDETAELDDSSYKDLRDSVPGLYGGNFNRVLPRDWRDSTVKDDFKRALWKRAIQRLQDIERFCSRSEFANTFLCLFLDGGNHPRWKDYAPKLEDIPRLRMANGFRSDLRDLERKAAANTLPTGQPLGPNKKQDALSLEESLAILIHDFVEYFTLVRFWPTFVQASRFLINQKDRDDLRKWMFPEPSNRG
jgi:hypothetical protein